MMSRQNSVTNKLPRPAICPRPPESNLDIALNELMLRKRPQFPKVTEKIDAFIDRIKQLKRQGESKVTLLTAVKDTNAFLAGELNPRDYQQKVNNMQGKKNRGLSALGVVMMALFVTALVFCPPLLAGLGLGSLALAGFTVGAIVTGFGGLSFFQQSRRHGLSEAAYELRKNAMYEPPILSCS